MFQTFLASMAYYIFYLNNNFPLYPFISNSLAVVKAVSKIESRLRLLNRQKVTFVALFV